jgi:hypothetical protein
MGMRACGSSDAVVERLRFPIPDSRFPTCSRHARNTFELNTLTAHVLLTCSVDTTSKRRIAYHLRSK